MTCTVLVFPGSTEIGLEIAAALRHEKSVSLVSAAQGDGNHAPYVFSRHFELPSIEAPGFLGELSALVANQAVDYIFPAYDAVQLFLARHRDQLGALLIAPPLETCEVTRSKRATYARLSDVVPVPSLYELTEPGSLPYPVFVKPDAGQGSQGTFRCDTPGELAFALQRVCDPLVCEYLPGAEVTVDCFSDRDQGLLFCGGRSRIRTRAGISVATQARHDPAFGEFAERINSRIALYGAWFFQLKLDASNEWKLLEVGPRIAGAMAYHRVQGINFPLLSLYEERRIPVSIKPLPALNVRLDRAFVSRYRHELRVRRVYVDLDDTLIVRGQVNLTLVQLLYQWLNQGVNLTLLTRHSGDPAVALAKHRLSGIFDQVVHLKDGSAKSACIDPLDSIFIDDSFAERSEVASALGIPTFDCSMLELLIDARA